MVGVTGSIPVARTTFLQETPVPASQTHIPWLDGWRGIAILTVLLSHFTADFEGAGTFGVEIFFALSGYLISDMLFIKRVPLGYFFKRRISRIYPAFLFFICAMYFYARYVGSNSYPAPPGEVFFTLSFLRTYLPVHNSIWSELWPIGHIWSLNVEEHSYLWLGLGAFLCRYLKKPQLDWLFVFLSTIGTIIAAFIYAGYPQDPTQSPWHLRTECAAFCLLASAGYRVARHHFPALQKIASPLLAPTLVAISIYFYSEDHLLGAISLITPLCLACATNHLGETYAPLREFLSLASLRWLGFCSFSIYLWQEVFYTATAQHNPWMMNIWWGVFAFASQHHLPGAGHLPGYAVLVMAVAAGAASFYLIENPARLYLNKRWAKI